MEWLYWHVRQRRQGPGAARPYPEDERWSWKQHRPCWRGAQLDPGGKLSPQPDHHERGTKSAPTQFDNERPPVQGRSFTSHCPARGVCPGLKWTTRPLIAQVWRLVACWVMKTRPKKLSLKFFPQRGSPRRKPCSQLPLARSAWGSCGAGAPCPGSSLQTNLLSPVPPVFFSAGGGPSCLHPDVSSLSVLGAGRRPCALHPG